MSGRAKGESDGTAVGSVEDLLEHAYAIEAEAAERYQELADQMEMSGNAETATLFRELAGHEAKHRDEIKARLKGGAPTRRRWEYRWEFLESPEAADHAEIHYLMTPHHALRLALKAEERAFQFFERVAKTTTDRELAKLAKEFAGEEEGHIGMVKKRLAVEPEPEAGWDIDHDMPESRD